MSGDLERIDRLQARWKIWLEDDGGYVLGPGAFAMLKSIRDNGTIVEGAKALGMSYRYVWGVIRKIEKKLDLKLLDTRKGGSSGGGGAVVTEAGLRLIDKYYQLMMVFDQIMTK